MRYKGYYKMPIGIISIEEEDGAIVSLNLVDNVEKESIKESPLLKEANKQLLEYFQGIRKKFDLPIKLMGTEFQRKVWEALQRIPYGETKTYGQVAKEIGKIKGARAVGGANNKNPIMIIVPCHRVIGVNNSLTGFAAGLEVKKYLLDLEKKGKS